MISVSVLATHRHPRLRYVLSELGSELGWRFTLTTDVGRWAAKEDSAKISLKENNGGVKCLRLYTHRFLAGAPASAGDLETVVHQQLPSFFRVGDTYDYLACIFYVLSRYEEYGKEASRDAQGRFMGTDCHAHRNSYLERPVVREWAAYLATLLRREFPALPAPAYPPFSFQPTYDIDLLWAWRYRGLRGIGAGIRDLLRGEFRRAGLRFLRSAKQDPYLTLPFLEGLHDRYGLHPVYFWLLANSPHPEDTNPYPIPPEQIAWIKKLATTRLTGIHPSYESMEKASLFRTEAERLAGITGRKTVRSRQHWLRFRLPTTYRALQLAGISEEYSMGYADLVGWRAGTNRPFYWYDLEKEQRTGLRIHPFAAMDVTLKNYLQLGPAAAQDRVLQLATSVAPYGGNFQLLWHNSSFSDLYGWAGWQTMYERLLAELTTI